jgi:hypothetical protein
MEMAEEWRDSLQVASCGIHLIFSLLRGCATPSVYVLN